MISAVEMIAATEPISEEADIVKLEFDEEKYTDCKIFRFAEDALTDWALYIAYNRDFFNRSYSAFDGEKGTQLYKVYPYTFEYMDFINTHDIVIGPIADDRILFAYDWFAKDRIGIHCLSECLLKVDLGIQYLFKTEKATHVLNQHGNVKIIPFYEFLAQHNLSEEAVRNNLSVSKRTMRDSVDRIIGKYRRKGDSADFSLKEILDIREKELEKESFFSYSNEKKLF